MVKEIIPTKIKSIQANKKNKPISAREAALLTLVKVEKEGAYANIALNQVLREYPVAAQDGRLAVQIAYGAVRMQGALDYILAQLLTKPLAQLPEAILPILRLSLYQLLYLDKIPPSAAVNEGVSLAKRYGGQRIGNMVNAVLRQSMRKGGLKLLPDKSAVPAEYLSVTLSHPRWLVDYLLQHWSFGEVEQFCLNNNIPNDVAIRTNTLRINRDSLMSLLSEAGVAVEPSRYAPESIVVKAGSAAELNKLRQEGLFMTQGESSTLVAHALNPQPGMTVLDMCAAPGGKATHLAALMENEGRVLACDIHPHKLKLIEEIANLLGIYTIEPTLADALSLGDAGKLMVDALLLDAPCSGLGTLAARADSRWRKRREDIPRLADQGLQMLLSAANCLKPGGKLCYSTCTITEEENIGNIRRFLAARPDYCLIAMDKLADIFTDPEDIAAVKRGYIQLLPQKQGVEGFFIALLQRRAHG
ncbi:MAG: 16S rRNA (cytosine(967)-C(5))-methyltransferase RsmB [Clostridiales bacterium]